MNQVLVVAIPKG